MTDGDVLLREILTHPERDDVRLIYADWLDDHDRCEQAEFIRLQVELSREEGPHYSIDTSRSWEIHEKSAKPKIRRAVECLRRWVARDLIGKQYGPSRWLAELNVEWRRGFVEGVSATCSRFVDHAQTLFTAHPVRRAEIIDRQPYTLDPANRSWRWRSYEGREHLSWSYSYELPPPVHALLLPDPQHEYATRDEAILALGPACLRYGLALREARWKEQDALTLEDL